MSDSDSEVSSSKVVSGGDASTPEQVGVGIGARRQQQLLQQSQRRRRRRRRIGGGGCFSSSSKSDHDNSNNNNNKKQLSTINASSSSRIWRRMGGGGGGCFYCFKPSPSPDSTTSDPNDPNFTPHMLKILIETNPFYSKECNPHS